MGRLALKAMLGDRGRLLTAVLGISFSVVLMNLQGALFLGLMQKASLLVDYGQADIWIGHRHSSNVDLGTYIPERWLTRVRSTHGVERAEPYIVTYSQARMRDGHFENVIVVGSHPTTLLGNAWVMAEGDADAIRKPDAILVDSCDAEKLGHPAIGDVREINGCRAQVVGMTHGIVGFTTDPYVFTTLERARTRYGTGIPPSFCSYYLVKAQPGADIPDLVRRLRRELKDQAAVYDRNTYSRMCVEYWLTRTGIGLSFGLAALLGLLVGLAVVAQTLYAAVTERAKEFGTLKALGATDRCLGLFVLAQAFGNAGLGSALGLGIAVAVGALLDSPRAPVEFHGGIMAVSVVLIFLVCLLAAWLPVWRMQRIDPAGVLRS